MMGVEMELDTYQLVEENRALKTELEKVHDMYERLQRDSKFNIQTASQLRDIIQARTSDEIQEKLMQKSLQNAELSMQVDQLNHQLKQSRNLVKDLGKERENNKKMLLELAGIVKTLNSVDLEYTPTAASLVGVGSAQEQSLQNIKRKVEAMMDDRERVLNHCQELEDIHDEQQEKIRALEDQFQMLNTLHMAQKESKDDPPSKSMHKRDAMDPAATDDYTVTSATEASTYASSIGNRETFDSHDREELEQTKEELETRTEELADARGRYKRLRDECQKVLGRVTEMENNLDRTRKELRQVKQKRDEFKLNLKTLITQYKDLHGENTEAIRNVLSLHLQARAMKAENDRLEEERRAVLDMLVKEADQRREELEQWKAAYFDESHSDYEELKSAYHMSLSKLRLVERQLADARLELRNAEENRQKREKHLRDTVANYRKLEKQQSTVLERIAESEKDLAQAQKHVHRYKEEAKHTRRRLALAMKELRKVDSERAQRSQKSEQTVSVITPTVSVAPAKATPSPVEKDPQQPNEEVSNEDTQETREDGDDELFQIFMEELEGQDEATAHTIVSVNEPTQSVSV